MTKALSLGAALPAPLRFALRELRGGWRAFRVFLACLALGVAAIAAVGALTDAVQAGLHSGARGLLGGDLEIRLTHRPLSAEERAWVEARAAAVSAAADLRAMAQGAKGERALTQLRAVDGAYPLIGGATLVGGGAARDALAPLPEAPETFGAVAAPELVARLSLSLGDRFSVGGATLVLRGVLESESDRGFNLAEFGPRLLISDAALAATGLIQPGALWDSRTRILVKPGDAPEAFRADLQAAFPQAGWRVRLAGEASPQIERIIDRLGQFLSLAGLTTLLVGGVGVAGAVHSFLSARVGTIAVMKGVGGSQRQIAATYLICVLAMALIGSLVGAFIGGLAPSLLALVLGPNAPAPIAPGFYWGPMALATGFGLLTALAFSLWPLGRAAAIRPAALFRDANGLDAHVAPPWPWILAAGLAFLALAALAVVGSPRPKLAAGFIAGAFLASLLALVCAQGLRRLAAATASRPRSAAWRMALSALGRGEGSGRSMVAALALGLCALTTAAQVQANLDRGIAERLPARAPSFFFLDIQNRQLEDFRKLATARGEDLTTAPMLRGRIVKVKGVPADQVKVAPDANWVLDSDRGLTYAAEPPAGSNIVAGAWWAADYRGPALISFDAGAAAGLGVGIGDTLTINLLGREIDATIANLRKIDWTSFGVNFAIVMSPGLLDRAPHTHLASLRLPQADEAAFLTELGRQFPNIAALRVRDALATAGALLHQVAAAAEGVSVLTVLAGALALAGASAADRRRRIRDAVIMKVLGATRRDLATAFLIEHGVVGFAAALLAAIMGSLGAWALTHFALNQSFAVDPVALAVPLVLGVAASLALGYAETWAALSRKAAPLLRTS